MLNLNIRCGFWGSCILLLGMVAAKPAVLMAQDGAGPLRVAIVGLAHGHVDGFLSSLAQHKDVELVGIADEDQALFAKYKNKYSLAETLIYKSEANMI